MSADWQTQLIARLPEPLRHDPKKASILGGLVLVMAGVMLKQFLFTGSPSRAAAAPAPANATVGVVPNVRSGSPSDNQPRRAATAGDPVQAWLSDKVRPLDRNPFEFHPEFFPTIDADSQTPTAHVVEDEMFWDRLAKSIASRADQRRQRQIRIENLQIAAGKLRVQSTIMGPTPHVMIAGAMKSVGDTVEAESGGVMLAFQIVRIEGRRIVLEREGVKLELPMGADRARVIVEE